MSLILWIERERKRRFAKGVLKYRSDPSEPFNGNGKRATDHMLEEVADALNYNEQAARDGDVTAWAACEIEVHLHAIVQILEADVLRMKHSLASPDADGPEAA